MKALKDLEGLGVVRDFRSRKHVHSFSELFRRILLETRADFVRREVECLEALLS